MPQQSKTFEFPADRSSVVDALRESLNLHGFMFRNIDHAILSGTRDSEVVTLYSSGRLVIQSTDLDQTLSLLGPLLDGLIEREPKTRKREPSVPSLTNMLLPRIGSDESGKGDYFGPLVTAAVLVDETAQESFEAIGVRDSKKLSDTAIVKLARRIAETTEVASVPVGPERYNELHRDMGSVNRILGWAHARAIENILEKATATVAVADQFGDESYISTALFARGKKIELRQMPKAESDLAVAAASIVARAEFVRRLDFLANNIGFKLPKGASDRVVDAATSIAQRGGMKLLSTVAKLHFKTTQQVQANL